MTTATATETRTDEEIQRDVIAELRWDARVKPNEIGVQVKGGVVTLTGWVDSYMKKWAAEEAAHRVKGVKAVANDVEVRLPGDSQRTDADIAAAVAQALDGNPRAVHFHAVGPERHQLAGKLQERYGYEREKAENELERLHVGQSEVGDGARRRCARRRHASPESGRHR